MTRTLHAASILLVIVGLALSLRAEQRDVSAAPVARANTLSGTASISGVVVLASDTPTPMRRAIVSVSGEGLTLSRDTITDDEGRFVVSGLPAGRFAVSAARAGFITLAYGAAKPGRTGSAIALAAGQQITNVRLQLARGASIDGTIRGSHGEPIAGIDISVQRRERNGTITNVGPNVRTAALGYQTSTDDLGGYRLYGLAPGDYIVSARYNASGAGDLTAPTESDVDAALTELARRAPARPAAAPAAAAGAPSTPSTRSVSILPIYYPDALAPEDASAVHLEMGDERHGVDMTMRPLSAASIEGVVTAPAGGLPAQMSVRLSIVNSTGQTVTGPTLAQAPGADGRFKFTSVPPGKYNVSASVTSPVAARFAVGIMSAEDVAAAGGMGPCYTGWADVSTIGGDVSGISLPLHACPSLLGRFEFAGTSAPPDPASVQITVMRAGLGGFVRAPRITRLQPDGQFEWAAGLTPGTYYPTATVPGSAPGKGWWLRSVMLGGRDLLDSPLVFDATMEGTRLAVLTFVDVHSSIAGKLQTPATGAASDYTVVVFPSNREWWTQPFRRVQVARPASDGAFVFQDLPAGEYMLAALTDVEPGEWQDPQFLAELVGSSVRVTIGEGERKVQDVAIAAAARTP